jgi:uncharacterized protein with HEPN domain
VKDDELCLTHIADAIAFLKEDSAGGRDAFLSNRRTQQLLFHNLQIIGEAVKRIGPETRAPAPHIPWTRIAGLRDALVHNYDGINPERIWEIIKHEIPRLETAITALIMIVQARSDKGEANPASGD